MSLREHDLASPIGTLDAGGHVRVARSPTYLIVVLALGLLVGAGLLAWLVYVVGDGVRRDHDPSLTTSVGSRIEGVGRQRVETSFIAADIDRMARIPDAAAVAAVRLLEKLMRSGRLP